MLLFVRTVIHLSSISKFLSVLHVRHILFSMMEICVKTVNCILKISVYLGAINFFHL